MQKSFGMGKVINIYKIYRACHLATDPLNNHWYLNMTREFPDKRFV